MATPMTYVEAPPRTARPNTSLQVLPVIDVSTSHHLAYQFIPDPCAFPNPLPQDCWVTIGPTVGTLKTFSGSGDEVVTDNFGAYQGVECWLQGGLDTFSGIAERVLRAGEYRVVDGALGALLTTSATAAGTAADSMAQAIGLLEMALAADVPALGYIYLSPVAATLAAAEHLLVIGLDGALTTYLGTPVVILTEPSLWDTAFASGPTTIWRGPIIASEAPEPTMNTGRALAERLYSIAIECGAWKVDIANQLPDAPAITLALQTIPEDEAPVGTQVMVTVESSGPPTAQIMLYTQRNAEDPVLVGPMNSTSATTFELTADTSDLTAGDVYGFYASEGTASAAVRSPIVTITLLEPEVPPEPVAWVLASSGSPSVEFQPVTLTLTAGEDVTAAKMYQSFDAGVNWTAWQDMTATGNPGEFTFTDATPSRGTDYWQARPEPDDGTTASNTVAQVIEAPAHVPIALTASITPDPLAAGAQYTAHVTAASDAGSVVMWFQGVNGVEPSNVFDVPKTSGTQYDQNAIGQSFSEGDVVTMFARYQSANGYNDSNTVEVTVVAAAVALEGWTIAELREFAAQHDPVIDLPSSWTKQQILDAILLAIAHDEEP